MPFQNRDRLTRMVVLVQFVLTTPVLKLKHTLIYSVKHHEAIQTHQLAHVDVLKSWKLSLLRIWTHFGNITDKFLAGVWSCLTEITGLGGPFSLYPHLNPRQMPQSLWSHRAIKQHVKLGKPVKSWPQWCECRTAANISKAWISPTVFKGLSLLRSTAATNTEANHRPWSPQSTMPLSPH